MKLHTIMPKKLAIFTVIVNYKTYGDLSKCLAALEKQGEKEKYAISTIIIDSEYQEEDVKKLKKKYPQHIFILQKQSFGFSANFNKGFKKAITMGANFVLMMSPDVYLQKNVLKTLVKRMMANKKLGAITCKTLLPTVPPRIYFVSGIIDPVTFTTKHIGYFEEDKGQYDTLGKTEYLNGALILIRTSVFEKVGFWEPTYFLYYEDADWTIRLKRAGYNIEVMKNVFAWHAESSTVGRKSNQQEYYLARNHLLFLTRNAPLKNKFLGYSYVLKDSIKLLIGLITKNTKRNAYYILLGRRDFFLRRFGYFKISQNQ